MSHLALPMFKKLLFISFLVWVHAINAQECYVAGLACFEAYKLDCATEHLENCLKEKPSHKNAIELLGDIAVDKKDWEKAITLFGKLVTAEPNNANYHFKYGGAFGLKALNVNRLKAVFFVDDIRDHFLKATILDKNHVESRWGLVEFYVNLPGILGGGREKAWKYAEELYQIEKVDGLMSQGYIHVVNDEKEEGAVSYKNAIKEGILLHDYGKNASGDVIVLKSRYPYERNQLHYQIGKATVQYNSELDIGLAHLKFFIENYSVRDHITKDWGYYFKARLYLLKKQPAKAKEAITEALLMRPDFEEALALKKEL